MRRGALRLFSTVLIVAGVLVLADGIATLVWQEPLTALYGRIQQGKWPISTSHGGGPSRMLRGE